MTSPRYARVDQVRAENDEDAPFAEQRERPACRLARQPWGLRRDERFRVRLSPRARATNSLDPSPRRSSPPIARPSSSTDQTAFHGLSAGRRLPSRPHARGVAGSTFSRGGRANSTVPRKSIDQLAGSPPRVSSAPLLSAAAGLSCFMFIGIFGLEVSSLGVTRDASTTRSRAITRAPRAWKNLFVTTSLDSRNEDSDAGPKKTHASTRRGACRATRRARRGRSLAWDGARERFQRVVTARAGASASWRIERCVAQSLKLLQLNERRERAPVSPRPDRGGGRRREDKCAVTL